MVKPKKKILYVITKSNFGGAQRYVYELATSLPKNSFDVTVAFGGSGILKDKLEAAGINTRTIESFARDINLAKELSSLFELWKIIKEIQPDIVHLNSSKAGGSGALIARFARVPHIIFTAHGWPFLENRSMLWKIIVWKLSWITTLLAHTTILVSAYDKQHAQMPFVQGRFNVIRTAIPRVNFITRQTAQQILFTSEMIQTHAKDLWLVTTAELTPNKNILTAIKAVAAFNHTNPEQKVFYTIIGDGELNAELQEYVSTHNLKNEIHLAGYVPEARVYLKAFDGFLLPSLKEGMPYALLEAGAAELPTIASNVGGIPEIIDDGVNGLLINPRDQKTIEAALKKYTETPDLRKTYTEKLNAKIDSTFDLKTMVEKTVAIYNA